MQKSKNMIWFSFLVLISYIFICKYRKHLQFWRRKCVTYSVPVPFFGNLLGVILRKVPYPFKIKHLYDEFPKDRYNGIFEFSTPKLLIRDRKLAEDIFNKNFDHFATRKPNEISNLDDILGRNLYFSGYKEWSRIRPCVEDSLQKTPAETSFLTILTSMESLTGYLLENASKVKQPIQFEATDFFRRITNDVIAKIAFDYKCNSLAEKNNEFYRMTREILKIEGATSFKMFLCEAFPGLKFIFKILNLYPSEASNYFKKFVFSKNNTTSILHHLITSPEDRTEVLSEEDILAQVLSFFFVAFEPLVKTMSFLAYELALNVSMQKKLEREIDHLYYTNLDDNITYENFSKIRYFDAVVLETLRKWPSAVQIERTCTKDYILGVKKANECAIRLEKGDIVLLPVYGFHHDKEQYPFPDKFDPERFLNKDLNDILNTFNFFPFGTGPRRCIAMELSILIVKVVFFDLISKFEISVIKGTEIPLQINKTTTHLSPQNGIYLGLTPRK